MMIKTYEDALAAIGMQAADVEFVPIIKDAPVEIFVSPVNYSPAENAILARQEHILFE